MDTNKSPALKDLKLYFTFFPLFRQREQRKCGFLGYRNRANLSARNRILGDAKRSANGCLRPA
jgi:hypothetical protein